MFLRVTFILIVNLVRATSALECSECVKELKFDSLENISTINANCQLVNASHSSCSQKLTIDWQSKTKADIQFAASASEVLEPTNVEQFTIEETAIWLNKIQLLRTFEIVCFNANACRTDTITNIYSESQHLEHAELWAQLVTRLYYAPVRSVLECADNDDKPMPCPDGFCRLSSKDRSSFVRSCVSKSSYVNPYRVVLTTKTLSETDIETSMIYTCKTPMCNRLSMAKDVQKLLEMRGLLVYSPTTTTTVTTTTSTTTVTVRSSAARETVRTIIIFRCVFIVLMTFIF